MKNQDVENSNSSDTNDSEHESASESSENEEEMQGQGAEDSEEIPQKFDLNPDCRHESWECLVYTTVSLFPLNLIIHGFDKKYHPSGLKQYSYTSGPVRPLLIWSEFIMCIYFSC